MTSMFLQCREEQLRREERRRPKSADETQFTKTPDVFHSEIWRMIYMFQPQASQSQPAFPGLDGMEQKEELDVMRDLMRIRECVA